MDHHSASGSGRCAVCELQLSPGTGYIRKAVTMIRRDVCRYATTARTGRPREFCPDIDLPSAAKTEKRSRRTANYQVALMSHDAEISLAEIRYSKSTFLGAADHVSRKAISTTTIPSFSANCVFQLPPPPLPHQSSKFILETESTPYHSWPGSPRDPLISHIQDQSRRQGPR